MRNEEFRTPAHFEFRISNFEFFLPCFKMDRHEKDSIQYIPTIKVRRELWREVE